jgi:putative FmdB family regulatory protein
MPTYHYKCSACESHFELRHSIKEPLVKKCPECHALAMEVVIEPFELTVKGEIKTIGQLAEKNSKAMGKEQLAMKMEKDGVNKSIALSEKQKEVNKLGSLSNEQKVKYIETGKL